jgi:hypothetical protein
MPLCISGDEMNEFVRVALVILSLLPASVLAGWTEPQLVDSLNGEIDDFYPSISPDGQSMYFTRGNRIMVSFWNGQAWTTPKMLGDAINRGQRQVKAAVTPDNRTLYFTSWRAGGYGTYDIWCSEWEDSCQCWGEPTVLPPPMNSEYMEWDLALSPDGRQLYFSSNRGWNELDIYCSDWNDSTGNWGEPYNLLPPINTSGRDYNPSVSADGSKLYFASWTSDHPEGGNTPCWFGPVDIFVAGWGDAGWDSVENICTPITTGYWDYCPSISPDGTALYFASNRGGNHDWGDIYVSYWTSSVTHQDGQPNHALINTFELRAYPNPFNNTTTISFYVPRTAGGNVELQVYDVAGRLVKMLHLLDNRWGYQKVTWDGRSAQNQQVGSGIYFCVLSWGKKILKSTKITLMK